MTSQKRLSARMSHIAPFEAMEIYGRARELELAGHDVIHLEVGEPDFGTPPTVLAAAKRALEGTAMGYTSALGMMPLREAIANFYQSHYGVTIARERIIVTAGSSAALLLTFDALLNRGDEVLMTDPGYPCNRHFVRAVDGVPVAIAVDGSTNFQPTAADVVSHWRPQTAAVLIGSPANPTGTIIDPTVLKDIHREVSARGGTLIVDEIYQGLTYGVEPTTALATLEHSDNVFIINSCSKYFLMSGWRLGWMVVPAAYVRDIEKLAQNLFISPSAPAQHAALGAFTPDTIAILEARRAELHKRRDFLVPALASIGFQSPVTPQGAFYVYADTSGIARDSFVLSKRILETAHVGMTGGKDFGVNHPEKYMRIAYTQPIARLTEAVERIHRMTRSGS